jgi:aryl-alcohol dehydrogenase-like predicted oxidoreductase
LKLAWPLVEEIRRLAAAYGKTPAQSVLNWLVRDTWIYPIPGSCLVLLVAVGSKFHID